jgi:hypothetical protein
VIRVYQTSPPREIGYYDTPGYAKDVYVSDSCAYVADRDSGLRVIDVSKPWIPKEIGHWVIQGEDVNGVHVSAPYAYVTSGERWGDIGYLRVIDITIPSNPEEISHRDLGCGMSGTPAQRVYVSGSYAYVICNFPSGMAFDCCVCVVNISNPSYPRIFSHDRCYSALDICASGSYIYVASDHASSELLILYLSIQHLQEVGCYDTPAGIADVHVSGSYAYATSSGLRVLDVSTPSNPQEVGYCEAGYALDVYVSGSYAYVADDDCGLRIIDVSTPSNPQEIGCYDTPNRAQGVYVAGFYAYVATRDSGLRVIDVSTPSNPQEVGHCDAPGYAKDVYVSDLYAYVATGGSGLRVIDVSTPSNPQEVGYLDMEGLYAMAVCVSGSYAYVAACL